MPERNIIVVPYNEKWPEEFEKIRERIATAVGDLTLSIEHVGSTSVKGLWAKPIIDMDVIIKSRDDLSEIKKRLLKIDYHHEGNLGIEGREAFWYEDKFDLMTHNMYVCALDCAELKRHLKYRDYLRSHPEAVEEYSKIKREAAALYPHDIDSYIRHKDPVGKELFKKCGIMNKKGELI